MKELRHSHNTTPTLDDNRIPLQQINMHFIQIYSPHLHSVQFKRVQYNQRFSSPLQVWRWQHVQLLSADAGTHQSIFKCAPIVDQNTPWKDISNAYNTGHSLF